MNTYQYFAKVLASLLGSETAVCLTVNGYMPLSVEDIGQSTDGHSLMLSRITGSNRAIL